MQYFNGLVARFLMFAAMYKIQKWVTFGSFLGQMDEAHWVSGSSGSLNVTRLFHAQTISTTNPTILMSTFKLNHMSLL